MNVNTMEISSGKPTFLTLQTPIGDSDMLLYLPKNLSLHDILSAKKMLMFQLKLLEKNLSRESKPQ